MKHDAIAAGVGAAIGGLMLAALMLLTGCGLLGDAERHLDDAAAAIRAAAIVADRAEPHLRLEYETELARCAELPDVAEIDPCTARVREAWRVTREALETVRAMRCASEPSACTPGAS